MSAASPRFELGPALAGPVAAALGVGGGLIFLADATGGARLSVSAVLLGYPVTHGEGGAPAYPAGLAREGGAPWSASVLALDPRPAPSAFGLIHRRAGSEGRVVIGIGDLGYPGIASDTLAQVGLHMKGPRTLALTWLRSAWGTQERALIEAAGPARRAGSLAAALNDPRS